MSTAADLFPIVDDAITVDRSTLEHYADCPRAAAFTRDRGDVESKAMVSGSAVHDAISETLKSYVACGGDMAPAEIEHSLTLNLRNVRPDLQPDALEAVPEFVRRMVGWMLAEHHAGNILRFDGGEGDQSGQLARDVTIGDQTIRVTSELDLLMATRSPDVLAEHDWKTGWTPWTADDVLRSFQFALHWWIVADVYPDAAALDITIWATRHGKRTDRVRFQRRDLYDIEARVMAAVGDWFQHRSTAPALAPARPFEEKCGRCPFTVDCFDAATAAARFDADETPEAKLDRLVTLNAAVDSLTTELWKVRDARGADIVSPNGPRFGWDKPKRQQRPANPVYSSKE